MSLYEAYLSILTNCAQEINLRQVTASNQQSEVVRYLTELNEWLGRDQQDRQSEFRGIGSRLDMLHALINGFVHQTSQLYQPLSASYVYSLFFSSTFTRYDL